MPIPKSQKCGIVTLEIESLVEVILLDRRRFRLIRVELGLHALKAVNIKKIATVVACLLLLSEVINLFAKKANEVTGQLRNH